MKSRDLGYLFATHIHVYTAVSGKRDTGLGTMASKHRRSRSFKVIEIRIDLPI